MSTPQIAQLIGSAGSGKTKELLDIMEKVVQQLHDPHLIGFSSFTRIAREVAATRAADMFNMPAKQLMENGWFRTCHSTAFKAIGARRDNILSGNTSDMKWLSETLQERLTVCDVDSDAEFVTPFADNATDAGKALMLWDLARNRMEPFRPVWEEIHAANDNTPQYSYCVRTIERYEECKLLDNRLDFTDMLALFAGYKFRLSGPDKTTPAGDSPDIPCWILDECVAGNTLVTLSDGTTMPIEQIVSGKVACEVMSMNTATGMVESRKVVGWHKVPRKGREILQVGNLFGTYDHPVWTDLGRYATIKELAGVLNTAKILEIDNEKIRSNAKAIGVGGVYFGRVASWRCVNKNQSGEKRKCKSGVRSFGATIPVSCVEVRESKILGRHAAYRPHSDRIRRKGVSVCDIKQSSVHRSMGNSSAWRSQANRNRRVLSPNERFCMGSVFYGPRIVNKIVGRTQHLRVRRGKSQRFNSMPSEARDNVANFAHVKRKCVVHVGRKCKKFRTHGRAISSTAFSLQVRKCFSAKRREANNASGNNPYHRISEKGRNAEKLRYVRSTVSCRSIGRNMLGRVQAEASQDASKKIRSKKVCYGLQLCRVRGRVLANFYEKIRKASRDTGHVLKKMHWNLCCKNEKAKIEPDYVYCLSVEGNNNFFADGILVHNCQDSSRLIHECQMRLISNQHVKWVYMAADPFQCLFQFAGSDPDNFLTGFGPAAKRRIMPQSYRCPPPILELGEKILRGCSNYFDRKTAPAGHAGKISTCYLDSIREVVNPRDDWLLLARTNFQAARMGKLLDAADIPWSPIKGNSTWTAPVKNQAIQALMNIQSGAPIDGVEWKSILKNIKTKDEGGEILEHGVKAAFENCDDDMLREQFAWVLPEDLREKLGATEHFMQRVMSGEWVSWIKGAERYRSAVRKYGPDCILRPSAENGRVRIGTVHSAKGDEAKNVGVLTTISEPCVKNAQTVRGRNGELMCKYVAVTRSSRNLVIIREPNPRFSWGMPQ